MFFKFLIFFHSLTTLWVIMCLSKLFKRHPDLTISFNEFLPPGYNIRMNPTGDVVFVYRPGHLNITLHAPIAPSRKVHSYFWMLVQ